MNTMKKPVQKNLQEFVQKQANKHWAETKIIEGQLSVDVYSRLDKIIVKAMVAGTRQEDLNISLNEDLLTIRGRRFPEKGVNKKNYFIKENYWGAYSRTLILPVEVDQRKIKAEMENGVLTIILQKLRHLKKITIKVKE